MIFVCSGMLEDAFWRQVGCFVNPSYWTNLAHVERVLSPSWGHLRNCNPQSESRQPKTYDRRLRNHGRCVLFLFMLLDSVVRLFVERTQKLYIIYVKIVPNWSPNQSELCLGGVFGGLGSSWGALGGLNVDPSTDSDRFLDHFRDPFWMYFRQNSMFLRTCFSISFSIGLGIDFGVVCDEIWVFFK